MSAITSFAFFCSVGTTCAETVSPNLCPDRMYYVDSYLGEAGPDVKIIGEGKRAEGLRAVEVHERESATVAPKLRSREISSVTNEFGRKITTHRWVLTTGREAYVHCAYWGTSLEVVTPVPKSATRCEMNTWGDLPVQREDVRCF